MPDPIDILHVDGLARVAFDGGHADGGGRSFLSVWFRCCHAYGRLYRNVERTMYCGRCPSCGTPVRALIGAHGTSRRAFEAR